MGFITVTTVVAVQGTALRDQLGVVSTLPVLFRNIGATIGVALMGSILRNSSFGVRHSIFFELSSRAVLAVRR